MTNRPCKEVPYLHTKIMAGILLVLPALASQVEAKTMLVFVANDETDNIAFPAIDPANTAPFGSLGGTFTDPDFRVIQGGNESGGGEKRIGPGVTWVFDDSNLFESVTGSDVTPGCTAYCTTNGGAPSPATAGDTGLFKNAPFLGSPFGFLAPTLGSAAGSTYGVGQLAFTTGVNFTVTFPVLEAQWAGGIFTLGRSNGGIIFTGNVAADNHFFEATADRIIDPQDDTLGFAGQYTQWDVTGSINSDPMPNVVSYSTQPTSSLAIPLTNIATDREGDGMSIQTTNPTVSGTANGSVSCTAAGCTYNPAGTAGTDQFTITVNDDFATVPGSSDITLTVQVSSGPTANPDNFILDQGSANNSLNLLANDTAGANAIDPASITIVTPPAGALGALPGDGTVPYTPVSGFSGIDSFTYTVSDTTAAVSNTATVNLTVNCTDVCGNAGTVQPGGLTGNIRVTIAEILASGVPTDTGGSGVGTSCDPDCFDFVTPATPASIVFALSGPIQANSTYREVVNSQWQTFDATGGNALKSAPGSAGSCPPPGDTAYTVGLSQGNFCLEIATVKAASLGGIGFGSATAVKRSPQELSSSPSCTISKNPQSSLQRADWWLVFASLGVLWWRNRRQSRNQ